MKLGWRWTVALMDLDKPGGSRVIAHGVGDTARDALQKLKEEAQLEADRATAALDAVTGE